jgi:Ca2+-binding RTX toxin-like protein
MSFAKLGSQHTVNTTVPGDQYRSAVTQLLNGDIVVAWTDANGAAVNVRGQILNADGVSKDGSEFMLNTTLTGSQYDVSLTALGNGGFAAGWTSAADWSNSPFDFADDASQSHVVTQVFAADGDKVGGEDTHALFIYDYSFLDDYLLPDIELTDHLQGSTALTANLAVNSDDFDLIAVDEVHYTDHQLFLFTPPIANWINYEGGENNIVRFSDGDAEILNDRVEDVTYAHNQSYSVIVANDPPGYPQLDSFHAPKAITLSDSTVITAYERHSWDGSSSAAWLEKKIKVDFGNGASPASVGSDYSENPALAELDNGNIIVVWEDGDVGGGVDNIVGQLFSPGGTKIGGEFTIDSSSSNTADPAVAALTDGRFIVVWEDMAGDGSGSAIKGQVFTAGGDKSGEAFTVNTSTADDQKYPTVTALANGDAFVTWTDYDGSTSDIYSQVLDLQSYVGDGSAETVYGGSLGDHLDGGAGADVLFGRGGDDVFENVTPEDLAEDVFDGGDGTDTLDLDDYVLQLFGPPVLLGDNGTVTSVEVINLHGPTAGVGINNVELAIPLANSSSDETVTVNGALAQDFIYGDRINNADISLHLNGGGGDDYLYGGAGGDTLDGGDDEDTLEGNGGDDWLEGGGENDTLLGGAGIDYLFGEQGDDYMEGGSGGDTYFVDSAGDVVVETFDPVIGVGSFDYVSSTIDYTLGAYVERLGLEGSADIDGTGNSLGNYLFGNSGDNVLSGLGGIDDISGFEGADHLYGGSEGDELDGGAGDDNLFGEEGDDTLIGGSEDDELDGGTGADIMAGGTGDDVYIVDNAGDVVTELNNEGTADLIMSSIGRVLPAYVENLWLIGTANINGIGNLQGNMLVGNAGNNALTGVTGADYLYGFGGNDVLWGGADGDTIDGGEGIDTAVYTASTAGVYADISANLYFGGHATGDTVTGVENLIGSSYDDVLVGYTGANVLTGAAGDDALFGAFDDDVLLGGKDDDTLTGGTGADVLNGGDGADTASYLTAAAGLTVSLTTGTGTGDAQGDTFISIENLTGSGFNDTLVGDGNANVLNGDLGIDSLFGEEGDDTLIGGSEDDELDGGIGADEMLGGEGRDTYIVDDAGDVVTETIGEGYDTVLTSVSYDVGLYNEIEVLQATGTADLYLIGSLDNNSIIGNAGNNAIVGSYGKDTTTGGAGYDVHVWQSIDEIGSFNLDPDIVTDLNRAEGDLLDFGAIDADSAAANGDTAFTFIGTADNPFTAAGQISFAHVNGTDTHILLNTDADPAAEAIIQVSGMHPVDASWFVL